MVLFLTGRGESGVYFRWKNHREDYGCFGVRALMGHRFEVLATVPAGTSRHRETKNREEPKTPKKSKMSASLASEVSVGRRTEKERTKKSFTGRKLE